VSEEIRYMCSECRQLAGKPLAGFRTVNEVGRKSCDNCGSNRDDLNVVGVEVYDSLMGAAKKPKKTAQHSGYLLNCPLCGGKPYRNESLISTKVPKPRELPVCGTGGLHEEQQHCYELGYREGVAALRKAQRERLALAAGWGSADGSTTHVSSGTRIGTTYPIRKIPPVPSATRNMPFKIRPVK